MSPALVVFTTAETPEQATKIAEQLVSRQLAACVQVDGPVTSYYRWQGKLETNHEWRLTIKTSASCYEEMQQAIVDLHPYEVPELVAVPVDRGLPSYMQWLDESTKG